jgi:hypothetical protein
MKDCHSKIASQQRRWKSVPRRAFGQAGALGQSTIQLAIVVFVFLIGTTALSNAGPPPTRVENIVPTLMSAFGRVDVVALGEHHGSKFGSDLALALIRNPIFPKKARFILVEWANSLNQPILDRYVMGGDVSMQELRQVWQNTTQITPVFAAHREFLTAVRQLNQSLQRYERIRVLAGDPPIDWSHVHSQSEYLAFGAHRDDFAFGTLVTAIGRGERGLVILRKRALKTNGRHRSTLRRQVPWPIVRIRAGPATRRRDYPTGSC